VVLKNLVSGGHSICIEISINISFHLLSRFETSSTRGPTVGLFSSCHLEMEVEPTSEMLWFLKHNDDPKEQFYTMCHTISRNFQA
jgi:hypothetical protein